MTHLLRIDASARASASHSRSLADIFTDAWARRHPGGRITRRDLVASPIPHIENDTILGYYTPVEQHDQRLRQAVDLSDRLIAEVLAADTILVATPMYNFTVPSALKAYIDQIVRIGRTFSYDGTSFSGLLTGKTAYVITAYGAAGYHNPAAMQGFDFLEPYLRRLFNFLGIAEVTFLPLEGTTADAASVAAAAGQTRDQVLQIAAGT